MSFLSIPTLALPSQRALKGGGDYLGNFKYLWIDFRLKYQNFGTFTFKFESTIASAPRSPHPRRALDGGNGTGKIGATPQRFQDIKQVASADGWVNDTYKD